MNIDNLFSNYINSNYANIRLKESTKSTYCRNFETYIRPYFLNIEINENSIIEFSKYLLFKLSRKTVNDILTLFSSILKINNIYIEVYKPNFTIPNIESLNDNEWQRLEDYCITHIDFITFGILLSLYTGVRPGELCASKKSNLYLIENKMKISHTLQRIKNLDENATTKTKIIIDIPKSQKSIRTLPLINDLCLLAENLFRDISPKAFLLTGNENKFFEVRQLERKVNNIYEMVGINNKNLYCLRHSFATNFYDKTLDIKTLSELLGHKDIKTTYRYIFTSEEKKRQGVNSLVQKRN